MPIPFRKKTLKADDANAYAQANETWNDGREALSSSIQQHTANLKGEDDLELTDDIPMTQPTLPPIQPAIRPRPPPKKKGIVGIMRSKTKYSKTSPAPSANNPALTPLDSMPPHSVNADEQQQTPQVSFSRTTKKTVHTSHVTKRSTQIRAAIALSCLIISLVLANYFGRGATGLWITHHTIQRIPGTTSVKEPPVLHGIPGPFGRATAYNGTFDIPDLEAMNILLSPQIENFADWKIPFPASNRTDLPFFWHVPKSGGTVVQRILGQCLGLVEASSQGAGHNEPSLQIFETSAGTRYINVDSTTLDGIERAKNLGLAESGLADAMFSPYVLSVSGIFNPIYRGRMFAIFRHPIERAMSCHHTALQENPDLVDMPLAEFAAKRLPNNEMVRLLTNKKPTDDLQEDDLFLAMEILRRKCVVGLIDRMEESLIRFHGYFGWYSLMVEGVANCQAELLAPAHDLPVPLQNSEAWNVMIAQNRFDLRLYEYAQYLFDLQGGNARESSY